MGATAAIIQHRPYTDGYNVAYKYYMIHLIIWTRDVTTQVRRRVPLPPPPYVYGSPAGRSGARVSDPFECFSRRRPAHERPSRAYDIRSAYATPASPPPRRHSRAEPQWAQNAFVLRSCVPPSPPPYYYYFFFLTENPPYQTQGWI